VVSGRSVTVGPTDSDGGAISLSGDGTMPRQTTDWGDSLHARDVVGAISSESLESNPTNALGGSHAELGLNAGFIDQGGAAAFGIGPTAHIKDSDVAAVIHQLEEVAIAAQNAHAPPIRSCPVGKGAEHIVGFKARGEAERQLQLSPQNLLELLKVLEKVSGCNVAMGFVVGICLMAEGGFSRIERDRHTVGLQPFAVIEQSLEKSIGHARWNSIFGGQSTLTAFAEGVKTAERQ
jgi:hypothetical protein